MMAYTADRLASMARTLRRMIGKQSFAVGNPRGSTSAAPANTGLPFPEESASDAFVWLIAPVGATRFERDFYERHWCLIERTDTAYYADLLDVRDLDSVLGAHNVTAPEVNLVRGDDSIPKRAYVDSSGRVDALAVAKLFDEGATVAFNQLHRRIPALSLLCASLGKVFSSRLQTNIYLTPADSQGFRPHWDTHDVFVLQISGRKQWTIYDTLVTLPLKGQGFDPDRHVPGRATAEFELGPGSAVYIPRG